MHPLSFLSFLLAVAALWLLLRWYVRLRDWRLLVMSFAIATLVVRNGIIALGGFGLAQHSRADFYGLPNAIVVLLTVVAVGRLIVELKTSQATLRALATHQQTVREEERTRIAREIHDELGQSLTAVKINLKSIAFGLRDIAPLQAHRATDAIEVVDATIETMRRIATDLRPGVLDMLGLAAAIEWQAREFQARTQIVCDWSYSLTELPLKPDCETAVFRVLQESLTNVARHAQATQVTIELKAEDDYAVLQVRDNGRGCAESELHKPQSFGLVGMRERALIYHGQLSINPTPGGGTTVILRLPLHGDCSPLQFQEA